MRLIWLLLRQHRDLGLLVGAGLISMSGNWILGVGLAYYVYDLTGSTLASAAMLLALFLPSILVSSVAGVLVDRWNRKTTMVCANLLLAIGLLPLLLVRDPTQVWIVYAVTTWDGIVKLFFSPAEQATLPLLVADRELPTANAVNGQMREIARLVGPALGGVVVATGGITALALADAATFLMAALLISRIRTRGSISAPAAAPASPMDRSRLGSLVHEWAAGLRVARSQRGLRVIFLFSLIAMTGEGIMGTLFVPFVRDVLHGSGQAYGLIVSVQAIGGIAGGLVAASLGQRVSARLMFGIGAVVFGSIDLLMFLYPLVYVRIWPAVACMIVVGLPGAVMMAGYNTLLQRSTTDAYRGRIFGALGVIQGLGIIVGTVVAGYLGEVAGIIAILSFQGLSGVIGGTMVLLILRPARAHDRLVHSPI